VTQPRLMDPERLHGLPVVDRDGGRLGKVSAVYLDVEHGAPEWAAVRTGFFGLHETLVPLVNATVTEGGLRVPYAKEVVTSAPHHDPDVALSTEAEAHLFDHFGVPWTGQTATAAAAAVPGPGTPPAEPAGALTLHEEQARVGVESVATGTARLRKHVVWEQVSTTLPLVREEVAVVREAIADGTLTGRPIEEAEIDVTLHAERAVLSTETVAVERVRLDTVAVDGTATVATRLGREVLQTEGLAAGSGLAGPASGDNESAAHPGSEVRP